MNITLLATNFNTENSEIFKPLASHLFSFFCLLMLFKILFVKNVYRKNSLHYTCQQEIIQNHSMHRVHCIFFFILNENQNGMVLNKIRYI